MITGQAQIKVNSGLENDLTKRRPRGAVEVCLDLPETRSQFSRRRIPRSIPTAVDMLPIQKRGCFQACLIKSNTDHRIELVRGLPMKENLDVLAIFNGVVKFGLPLGR